MSGRDFNREYQDGARKYAYDFDGVVRRYMMKALAPHFRPGRALELGCYTGDVTEMIAEVYDDLTVVEASSDLYATPLTTFRSIVLPQIMRLPRQSATWVRSKQSRAYSGAISR